ncbi:MAG: hypothetical protein JW810_02350 [Sedimentisphaerales bacterium]|nr:hypothetical protein [Sedimentisphaerales bacterium]
MTVREKGGHILLELKEHAPFTLFGAVLGLLFMLIFQWFGRSGGHVLFQIFHPAHVVLSALVTTALFRLHEKKAGFLKVLLIGYVGSVGVASLSDCIIPYFGESIFRVHIPVHHHDQETEPQAAEGGEPAGGMQTAGQKQIEHDSEAAGVQDNSEHARSERPDIHLGFIEDWYLVNPAALLGVLLGYFRPRTKLPHAGHVLVSTWASSAHVLMNLSQPLSTLVLMGFFLVLFLAVWLPCCVSDIVFPTLFVRSGAVCGCHYHDHAKETAP